MNAYQVASDPTKVLGKRVVAYLIDSIVLSIPFLVLFFSMAETFEVPFAVTCADLELSLCFQAGDSITAVENSEALTIYAVTFLVSAAMFIGWQGSSGKTVGKTAMGLRCVNEQGEPPGFGKAAIRWLLLFIDGICGVLGLIVAASSKGHRRVGDMAAKTFVVADADAGRPIVIPGLAAAYVPPVGAPAAPAGGPGQAQWDAARNAYIQWDDASQQWLQWNDQTQA